jgi:hypothetical protein
MKTRKILMPLLLCSLVSCRSELDDIEMNDNPYDQEYQGPKVIRIDSVVHKIIGLTKYNYVYMSATTQLYDKVHLYADGVKIKTINRTSFTAAPTELITHFPVTSGSAFVYEGQLGQNAGVTAKSEAVSFTTP